MADGAAGVIIAATHAILSDPAVDRLKNSSAIEVVVTNTLPVPGDKQFDKLTMPLDRAAHRARDPRGLRGRLGHLHVRRSRLISAARHARWLRCRRSTARFAQRPPSLLRLAIARPGRR